MCKSIFGVLKWSISPKKWYCCVSKHGDAMVLPPQNFHKLDVKFRFRPNSKCRISEYLWKIERKVPSWDNRTKMHRMHFVVFFCSKKNMSNAICVQLFENHPDESPGDSTGARQRFWPRASYGGPILWGPGPGIPNRFSSASTWTITGWWFGTFFPYIENSNPNWLIFFTGVGIPPTSIWDVILAID